MNTTKMKEMIQQYRQPSTSIDPVFINRWSPRSFSEQAISEEVLFSIFEAARWAASARNIQPWRFIFARSNDDRAKFHSFILEGNLSWCTNAPVLIMVLSKKVEDGNTISTHTFDVGMATANLLLQATNHGLATHFMGGIDANKAREVLEISDDYEIHGVIALGYQGDKEALPEALQMREIPNGRKELSEIVFEGNLNK